MEILLQSIGYERWILHALIFLPFLGALLALAFSAETVKKFAFWWTTGVFVLSLGLWWVFQTGEGGLQLVTVVPWIESWGIHYAVGIDGVSLFMVLLNAFMTPVTVLGAYNYIQKKERGFYSLILLLQGGVMGVFLALDLFLFYVFFELTLVPMYFIVGIWGGERRIYAAMKFFLYTAFGSLLMLVALLYVYWKAWSFSGVPSFLYSDLLGTPLSLSEQLYLFAAFCLAFSIKVPLFPLHTWLPDAHVEAPTPGSVILAAILLKMGTYGYIRFLLPLFPNASQDPTVVTIMMVLGVIGIIYAAWVAAVQPDAKKLVAYTSVAHMGFVVIGVFALTVNGIQGGLMVMISHGLSTGALFLLIGMLYERRHTRLIEDFGGLAKVMPWFATAFVITALASIGVPGTSGFIGEFLALLGTFQTHPYMGLVAATGVIFAAYYMLPMVQKIVLNDLDKDANRNLPDLTGRELAVLSPLLILMVVIGFFPNPILERMQPSIEQVLDLAGVEAEALAGPVEQPAPVEFLQGEALLNPEIDSQGAQAPGDME